VWLADALPALAQRSRRLQWVHTFAIRSGRLVDSVHLRVFIPEPGRSMVPAAVAPRPGGRSSVQAVASRRHSTSQLVPTWSGVATMTPSGGSRMSGPKASKDTAGFHGSKGVSAHLPKLVIAVQTE
jgi:hypothetical protein